MLTAQKQHYRRTLDRATRFSSVIGKGTVINGCFTGGENIIVQGIVKGDSDIEGVVIIMESGQWLGSLVADVVVVSGRVEGDIHAREKLEITADGHIVGTLQSPVIAMETGAIHEGRVDMHQSTKVTAFRERRETVVPVPV